MTKKVETISCVISALVLLWIAVSYIDVVAHNLTTCHYQWWNFFEFLVRFGK